MNACFSRRAIIGGLAATLLERGTARAQAPITLRVGAIPIDACGELFYAAARGSFAAAGIELQLQLMTSGAAIGAAIAGGALDLGIGDLVSVASAHVHGLPFVYLVPAAIYTPEHPGQALLVRPDSGIASGKDFSGKTIAVNAVNTLGQVTTQAWLDKNGGDWHAVRFVEMPFTAMGAALDNQTVDAVVLTEPGWTLTNGRFRSLPLGDTGIADHFLISGYVTTHAWAQTHAEAAARFVRVIRESGRWANANHAASAAILSAVSKIPGDVLLRASRSLYGETLTPALLQPLIDASARYGTLSRSFPAAELIA